MAFVPSGSLERQISESRAYNHTVSQIARRYEFEQNQLEVPAMLSDSFPPMEITDNLTQRFFDTLGTVYAICDRDSFESSYTHMKQDSQSVPVSFLIQTLLMIGLANATLPDADQIFTRASTLGWLNLASALPQAAMDLREFDISSVRMWALMNLCRQILTFDEVRSSSGTVDRLH